MKKLFLFFSIIALSFLMHSCLEGNENYSTSAFAYITTDDAYKTYARTTAGKLIVTPEVALMTPGEYKFFSFSWDEEYGKTLLRLGTNTAEADNARINGKEQDVSKTYINPIEAPMVETPNKFIELGCMVPDLDRGGVYFNNHWIIGYNYKIKKGQSAQVDFYKVSEIKTEMGNPVIIVDVRIELIGTPDAGASETSETKFVALNMSDVRNQIDASSHSVVYVKFRYFKDGNSELVASSVYPMEKSTGGN